MRKGMLLLHYTFYELNGLSTLFVQDIVLLSQRDVKTMLSIITSCEQELLNVFLNKVLIFPLMGKAETYISMLILLLLFRLNPLCPKHLVFLKKVETRSWWFLYRWPVSLNPLCKGMVKHNITFSDFKYFFRMQLSPRDCLDWAITHNSNNGYNNRNSIPAQTYWNVLNS